MTNFDIWYNKRQKSENLKLFGKNIFSGFITLTAQFILIFQFGSGGLRNFPGAFFLTNIFIILFIISFIFILIFPGKYYHIVELFGRNSISYLLKVIVGGLLVLVYIVLIPLSITRGKRRYLQRRPEQAPWLGKSYGAIDSTWVRKEFLFDSKKYRSGWLRLLGVFLNEGNTFLLIVTIILLFLAMFILFAQSSAVVPFIYTIF